MSNNIDIKKKNIRKINVEDIDNINIETLLDFNTIYLYNKSDESEYIDIKSCDNITFVNKCFKLTKELRENNYQGNIVVDCDSLYDIGNSYYNYESFNTGFTKSLYSMDAVNNFINCYLYNVKDDNYEKMSKRDLFVKILFFQVKEMFTYIEERGALSPETGRSIHNYIYSDLVYDIGKIYGANFIRYKDIENDIFYYFDNNSKNVFKYFPEDMLDKVFLHLDNIRSFLDYDGEDELLFQDVGKAYDEIMEENELGDSDFTTIYDDLLNCNSTEDFKTILSDCDKSIYYKLLLNILMDLSIDDYNKFISDNVTGDIDIDIFTLFDTILSIKEDLTKRKIVMSVCQAQK